jgi:hypothetical protein
MASRVVCSNRRSLAWVTAVASLSYTLTLAFKPRENDILGRSELDHYRKSHLSTAKFRSSIATYGRPLAWVKLRSSLTLRYGC